MNTVVRWDPAAEVDSLQSDVNRLFDGFFGGGASGRQSGPRRWIPPMDLAESRDELILTMDLPGLSEENVAIEVRDNVLTISGERMNAHRDNGVGFHRAERSFGRFSRALTLPRGVDAEEVAANFDRGVLEVRIPKPEERKPHRVSIGSTADRPETIEAGADEK